MGKQYYYNSYNIVHPLWVVLAVSCDSIWLREEEVVSLTSVSGVEETGGFYQLLGVIRDYG